MRISIPHVGAILACALSLASSQVTGQDYPNRVIRIVNGLAGAAVDLQTRAVAQGLEQRLKQRVIVESRSGAAGLLAHREVARSVPDGHTLLFAAGQLAGSIAAYKDPQYRLEDFVTLAPVSIGALSLVVPSNIPAKTAREFIDFAKARPGNLNYGSLGAGSSTMLAAERFKHATGVELTEIRYKTAALVFQDLIVANIHAYFSGAGNATQAVQGSGGRLKILAIAGATRSRYLPDTPTFKELGHAVLCSTWNVMVGPAGMPRAVTQRLRETLADTLNSPEFEAALDKTGLDAWRLPLDELDAFIRGERDQTIADFKRLKIDPQ